MLTVMTNYLKRVRCRVQQSKSKFHCCHSTRVFRLINELGGGAYVTYNVILLAENVLDFKMCPRLSPIVKIVCALSELIKYNLWYKLKYQSSKSTGD